MITIRHGTYTKDELIILHEILDKGLFEHDNNCKHACHECKIKALCGDIRRATFYLEHAISNKP